VKETLYEWFAASVAAHPHEPALEVGTDRLTYGQLDALAERLAAELVAAHGGVPDRVGRHRRSAQPRLPGGPH
jgi:non-ribosomal peptide synthetase component F